MNQKPIGLIVIIIGLALAIMLFGLKLRDDKIINDYINKEGTCYLTDGTCLHEEKNSPVYTVGWIIAAVLVVLGLYLVFFDKTQKKLAEHQVKVATALQDAKKDERWQAFLSGFTDEEKKALNAIKEQDGILQSTLRYRTGISKSSLSLLLKSLESREIITRTISGKTNKVFLQKKY